MKIATCFRYKIYDKHGLKEMEKYHFCLYNGQNTMHCHSVTQVVW